MQGVVQRRVNVSMNINIHVHLKNFTENEDVFSPDYGVSKTESWVSPYIFFHITFFTRKWTWKTVCFHDELRERQRTSRRHVNSFVQFGFRPCSLRYAVLMTDEICGKNKHPRTALCIKRVQHQSQSARQEWNHDCLQHVHNCFGESRKEIWPKNCLRMNTFTNWSRQHQSLLSQQVIRAFICDSLLRHTWIQYAVWKSEWSTWSRNLHRHLKLTNTYSKPQCLDEVPSDYTNKSLQIFGRNFFSWHACKVMSNHTISVLPPPIACFPNFKFVSRMWFLIFAWWASKYAQLAWFRWKH